MDTGKHISRVNQYIYIIQENNLILNYYKTEDLSPPQELEEEPQSGLYPLVCHFRSLPYMRCTERGANLKLWLAYVVYVRLLFYRTLDCTNSANSGNGIQMVIPLKRQILNSILTVLTNLFISVTISLP